MAEQEESEEVEYEIVGRLFESKYSGQCAVNWNHRVRKGTIVGHVQRADNPFIVIQGVACAACTKNLPRGKM